MKGLSPNDGSVTSPQGFIAVFKAGCVSALNAANKIVLVLLREECAGWGRCGDCVCFGL